MKRFVLLQLYVMITLSGSNYADNDNEKYAMFTKMKYKNSKTQSKKIIVWRQLTPYLTSTYIRPYVIPAEEYPTYKPGVKVDKQHVDTFLQMPNNEEWKQSCQWKDGTTLEMHSMKLVSSMCDGNYSFDLEISNVEAITLQSTTKTYTLEIGDVQEIVEFRDMVIPYSKYEHKVKVKLTKKFKDDHVILRFFNNKTHDDPFKKEKVNIKQPISVGKEKVNIQSIIFHSSAPGTRIRKPSISSIFFESTDREERKKLTITVKHFKMTGNMEMNNEQPIVTKKWKN